MRSTSAERSGKTDGTFFETGEIGEGSWDKEGKIAKKDVGSSSTARLPLRDRGESDRRRFASGEDDHVK